VAGPGSFAFTFNPLEELTMKGRGSSPSEMRGRRNDEDGESEGFGGLDDFEEDEEFDDADLDDEEGEEESLEDDEEEGYDDLDEDFDDDGEPRRGGGGRPRRDWSE
jgi:hypothetical protein